MVKTSPPVVLKAKGGRCVGVGALWGGVGVLVECVVELLVVVLGLDVLEFVGDGVGEEFAFEVFGVLVV